MTLYAVLARPELFLGSGADPGPIVVVAVEAVASVPQGHASILVRPASLVATAVLALAEPAGMRAAEAVPFEINAHDAAARRAMRETWQRLGLAEALAPLQMIAIEDGQARLYHRIETGPAGTLFTAIGSVALAEPLPAAIPMLAEVAHRGRALFFAAQAAFNPGMGRTNWKPGVELERKFTFAVQPDRRIAPMDTWRLHQALYGELRADAWAGFIPEFNEEFHVWDYESAMFEVTGPAHAQGYIAFIPQFDRRVTLKYKRFKEDAEQRYEDIANNVELESSAYLEYAGALSHGDVAELPGFRRKRFDCDLESLATGNAYGIFFDICRTTDGSEATLSQCEVEYLRTRSLLPVTDVEAEFNRVCALTHDFLNRRNADHQAGYYSKLSFVREIAQQRGAR